ncbi:MAG: XRE family transcriptional regulator [Methyloceanibacter sp.]|jgi:transcriptional regulator with XRE-family HTH domain
MATTRLSSKLLKERTQARRRAAARKQRTAKNGGAALPGPALATGSNAPTTGELQLEISIGRRVRLLRQRLQLTATELAQEAGLSPGMLSKIENGGTSPSLSTLQALARALNVPMTSFFADFEEKRDCSYVRAGQGVLIERRGTKSGHRYELLGHSISGDIVVEPYFITLSEDAEPYALFQHDGVEFIYMLSGKVIYRHADKLYPMSAGDALFFDAGAPHGPEELLERPMAYLSIIIYPRS